MKIGYGRVSTRDQDTKLQEEALEAAGCERIFVETASGAQFDRPRLKELLTFARPGDTIVVYKLDRMARSLRQLLATMDDLKDRGIQFQSLSETIDTSSSMGQLIFQIVGAFGEFERQLIRERTIAGLEHARSKGRVGGRPAAMKPHQIDVARALLAQGNLNVSEIADELGVSVSTIYRYVPGGRSATFLEAT
ncbi:recombinase family protein [Ponticaulis profundi]|uniref:Recombinase family protein n=1 Tax=Ponticaulis profundi TaxID=2665222 RepID=A0ABW1SCH0_9PROT